MTDYASVLQGAREDAVEVNQRALIDKVLARYSGESVVFRELLQNADDASASTVEIRFQSLRPPAGGPSPQPSSSTLPDLEKHQIGRIVVRNDGIVFRDQDWARLRKIAEGNPDESKIGAFGVGFYSLWSLCEAPVVISGDTVMGFNWSERNPDQLVTRRGTNPDAATDATSSGKPWTSFVMDVREAGPMPAPHEFSRFLATSLAFTVTIRTIRLYFDDHLLCQLDKKLSPPKGIRPGGHIGLSSPKRMMSIRSVDQTSLQIDAQVLPWILRKKAKSKLVASTAKATNTATTFAAKMLSAFSGSSSRSQSPASTPKETPEHHDSPRREDLLKPATASLFLRVVTANIGVSVSNSFSAELERATKKPPPKQTQYSLIWTSKDEWDASRGSSPDKNGDAKVLAGDDSARSVFDGLLSDLNAQGRVFIGFATHQTTGCVASVAARFIPTVERESLDLQAPHVADWNRELLAIGGTLSRIVYDAEIEEVAQLWKQTVEPGGEGGDLAKDRLIGRCLHAMSFFTFLPSTPSPVVSAEADRQFFNCAPNSAFQLVSTQGPQAAWKVRVPNPELAPFIKQIPFVPSPPDSISHAKFLEKLKDRRLVKDVTFDDVFGELNARSLDLEEMRGCLGWFVGLAKMQGYDASLVSRLKSSAMVSWSSTETRDVTVMSLSTARSFVNPKTIPTDLPLPLHTLPFDLTKTFRHDDLTRVFGFMELSIPDWLRRLVELASSSSINPVRAEHNLFVSPQFAETVLSVVARAWGTLGAGQQAEVVTMLKDKTCVPTRHGMRKPDDAYHRNVNLFEDLAVVVMPSGKMVQGALDRLMTALGVRRHVELQMVFSRLLGSGDWSHVELTRYLVSVRETLSSTERDRLINTKWLPRAREAKVPQPPGPDGQPRRDRTIRHHARDLFEPLESLVALGLPVVEWPGRWRTSSEEAQLLISLGLKSKPSVEELLAIAAHPTDAALRAKALAYFGEHFSASYAMQYQPNASTPAFVPCRIPDGNAGLARPTECYESSEAIILGFAVVEEAFRSETSRYGVRTHPRPADIIPRLTSDLLGDPATARKVFAYLSTRVGDFSKNDLAALKAMPILPLRKSGKITMVKPNGCYFASGDGSSVTSPLRGLFTYIDFGDAATAFLMAIGVKSQPTVQEITKMLVADPHRFYREMKSPDEYVTLLRNIAANFELIPEPLRREMQRSAFLLGMRRLSPSKANGLANGAASIAPIDSDDEDTDDEELGSVEDVVYRLAKPHDLVIVDMATSFRPFATVAWTCIQEAVIEDLAEALGAPRVSSLIKDAFLSSGPSPTPNQTRIEEVRRLVVERSALFLHERHTTSRREIRHDGEWLKQHLKVVQVSGLTLRRELHYGGITHTYSRKASASIAAPSASELLLYISTGIELDWFEVAMGLCKILLTKERPNDALMFNTILTTSLKNLKRRGMNVDRIINERKAERAAAEERERERKLQMELAAAEALSQEQIDTWESQLEDAFPDAQPGHIRRVLEAQKDDHLRRATEELLKGYPKRPKATEPSPQLHRSESLLTNDSTRSSFFDTFKRRLRPNVPASSPTSAPPSLPLSSMSDANLSMVPQQRRPAVEPPKPGSQATPLSDIKSNLLKAVAASRPDSNLDLHSKSETKYVKESESSYCDPMGSDADLTFATSIGGLRFYVSPQVPDAENAAELHADAIRRYAQLIIRPVGDVFDVDPRCLHVFLDVEGPLIAFNRNGSIFFNLRYYLFWYDERVKTGDLADALIGTFSSLAHELAHNLVLQHNSEHEWWMSAFIEQYFLRLAVLIGKQQQRMS